MTNHFKQFLKLLAVATALLIGGYLWLKHRLTGGLVYRASSRVVLPSKDSELITYNENRHTITVTTSSGTVTKYGRNPMVEIRKGGSIKVNADAWGTELRPFLGVGYSDTGRVYAGCQLFYFHSFDAGASFGWTADNRKAAFQPMLSLSYNFWSNTSLNIGANPAAFVLSRKPEIAVFLSVRL